MENVLPTFNEFALTYGIKVVGAILILILGRIVAGWLRKLTLRACTHARVEETLGRFFGRLVRSRFRNGLFTRPFRGNDGCGPMTAVSRSG